MDDALCVGGRREDSKLYRAERRAAEYMDCVQGVWDGTRTKAELFALMKNRSYNSDAPNSSRDGRA